MFFRPVCSVGLILHRNRLCWDVGEKVLKQIKKKNKMLEDAIKVYHHGYSHWDENKEGFEEEKALLINIQTGKKETAEGILRKILKGDYKNRRDIDLIKDIEQVLNEED